MRLNTRNIYLSIYPSYQSIYLSQCNYLSTSIPSFNLPSASTFLQLTSFNRYLKYTYDQSIFISFNLSIYLSLYIMSLSISISFTSQHPSFYGYRHAMHISNIREISLCLSTLIYLSTLSTYLYLPSSLNLPAFL